MAKIQCKMCGGMNEVREGATSWECPYCGMLTTFPKLDTEQREQLYARAEHFRQANNFDKAVSAYESILNLDGEDPEAWWGLLISKYGIEYVEDPATHERIPTCHRVQFDSILADPDYQNALKYAVGCDRDIYEREARRISEIQKDILRISAQEKPYDVFICYKETTDGGARTRDSVMAQDIYFQLVKQGLKVFFSRITLEKKLGSQYEPYIFAALNSAKVMLVIGTRKEHFEAIWVKNEWSRFLALKKKDGSKLLIPCFRDMDVYDIPEELSMFQSQDMSKIGFMQDLIYGIMKVVNAGRGGAKAAASDASDDVPEIGKVRKRISIFLAQGDWEKAVSYCERRLDSDPENPELYFQICLLSRHIPDEDALRNACCNILDDTNYQIALKYASPERKKQIDAAARDAAVNFFLKLCMDSMRISDPSLLPRAGALLCEDANFQAALQVAAPERKEDVLRFQYDQADFFLEGVKRRLNVASFEQAAVPLGSDAQFQAILNFASPERREELRDIQAKQCEFFLGKCMESLHVFNEADLARTESPLAENGFFKTALLCASPEREKELRKLQDDQSEFFLRKCMEEYHVSSEAELPECPAPLNENGFFDLALQCSPRERRISLLRIQAAQSDAFLRKCMEANHVTDSCDLAKCRAPLKEDANFRLAMKTAVSPTDGLTLDQEGKLNGIVSRQLELFQARKRKRAAVCCVCVAALFVVGLILWTNRLEIKATLGGAEAKFRLAQRYEYGDGVQKNMNNAMLWYRKAAERGHAEAQYKLGHFCVDSDWLRKAADQGHAEAQYELGLTYERGDGVKEDLSEAVKWYRKATEQGRSEAKERLDRAEMILNAQNGNAEAQFKLAQAYETGDGAIEKNVSEAISWYRKAAENGHAEAQFKLAQAYENGSDGVKNDLSEAVKWYRKAAEQGHAEAKAKLPTAELLMNAHDGVAEAQYKLAQAYETGDGAIEKNVSEAISWYRKAAENGHAEAQCRLGLAYETGDGVKNDLSEAVKWYRKAADQGHAGAKEKLPMAELFLNARNGDAEAQYELARRYETGDGVWEDPSEALNWYRKAARQGNAGAQCRLGLAYETGKGVTQDLSEAVKWYRKAAAQGHAEAQYKLGMAFTNGNIDGIDRSDAEAVKWFRKAAEQGHAGAKEALAVFDPEAISNGATEVTFIVSGKVSWKMARVGAGAFMMSARDGENFSEEAMHPAMLMRDFYIGRTEVTQAQWEAVMGNNPSHFRGGDLPVENVSWNDAMDFCDKLNRMGKAPRGWKFSLPTETQWEYAARGGRRNMGYKFSGSNAVDDVAWYADNSGSKTHPVGQKKANELGLYDMSGNVLEWCLDDWQKDGSRLRPEFSRGRDKSDVGRAHRGGSWNNNSAGCRSASRDYNIPGHQENNLGFRVALVPEKY